MKPVAQPVNIHVVTGGFVELEVKEPKQSLQREERFRRQQFSLALSWLVMSGVELVLAPSGNFRWAAVDLVVDVLMMFV